MAIDFKIDDAQLKLLKARLQDLPLHEQGGVLETMLQNVANLTQQRLVSNVSNKILKRRTGTLAKSIQWRVIKSNAGLAAFIGANVLSGRRVPYANILETGGTIKARRSKYLTVPLPAALTKAGTTKQPEARDFKNTFVKKARSGKLIIFQKVGKRGKIVPLFVLLKSVKIRPFRYLSTTLDQVKPRIFQIMNATISRELNP